MYKKHGVEAIRHVPRISGHGPRLSPPVRPIAAQPLWCHNPQRHEISSAFGETSSLPPVSKPMRADIGDRSRFGPLCKSCLGSAGWLAISGESERSAVSDWASALSWGRDETELVHELQAGSETAFDWLVTHYHAPVYNLILSMLGDTSDAADGSQEVFLKAFRGIRNFRQGSSLKTWLYRIAIREALNHKRWFKRHLQKNVSIDAQPEEGQSRIEIEDLCATPFEQLAALEIQTAVHGALHQIPEAFRSAVILRDLEGLSYDEVAEVLECNVGTVKSRILRGRRALKEILEPLLGEHQEHSTRTQTVSHGNVSEAQPSPFGDAFSAARRVALSSESGDRYAVTRIELPRASSTGKGVQ